MSAEQAAAAQALLDKAKVLEQLNSAQSASQVRQYLIDKYSDSEPAAPLLLPLLQSLNVYT